MGLPKSWMVYNGKSQSKLDDDHGYPLLWKPSYCFFFWISDSTGTAVFLSSSDIQKLRVFYLSLGIYMDVLYYMDLYGNENKNRQVACCCWTSFLVTMQMIYHTAMGTPLKVSVGIVWFLFRMMEHRERHKMLPDGGHVKFTNYWEQQRINKPNDYINQNRYLKVIDDWEGTWRSWYNRMIGRKWRHISAKMKNMNNYRQSYYGNPLDLKDPKASRFPHREERKMPYIAWLCWGSKTSKANLLILWASTNKMWKNHRHPQIQEENPPSGKHQITSTPNGPRIIGITHKEWGKSHQTHDEMHVAAFSERAFTNPWRSHGWWATGDSTHSMEIEMVCSLRKWSCFFPTKSDWWFEPLWKNLVNWDDYFQYMGKKHLPNHQPEIYRRLQTGDHDGEGAYPR